MRRLAARLWAYLADTLIPEDALTFEPAKAPEPISWRRPRR